MVGRVPTIHAFSCRFQVEDGRANRGHDGGRWRQCGYSTEKLVPQPQADLAFGLRTAKWLPINSSV
jgi:hypothetical protein